MDEMIILGGILVAIAISIGSWYIKVNNNMVFLEELCENALSQIGVYQGSKWEIIENLANMLKNYTDHESSTLIKIVEGRSNSKKYTTIEGLEKQDKDIKEAVKEISIVVENYPELKANELYLESMGLLNIYENNLRDSKLIYNDIINRYNREIRTLPNGIFIRMLGYKKREYIDAAEIHNIKDRRNF